MLLFSKSFLFNQEIFSHSIRKFFHIQSGNFFPFNQEIFSHSIKKFFQSGNFLTLNELGSPKISPKTLSSARSNYSLKVFNILQTNKNLFNTEFIWKNFANSLKIKLSGLSSQSTFYTNFFWLWRYLWLLIQSLSFRLP